jgi:signal transduction histidine kinase
MYSGEEERTLLETLAKDIAFAIKTIEDEQKKLELLNRLMDNLKTFAFIVDRIRNPLAVISGLAEMLVENEETRRKILQQVDRIVEIIQKIEMAWKKTENLTGTEDDIFKNTERG